MIGLLLSNSYAYFVGNIFQQIRGIPRKAACSPQFADLTLAYMDYSFITKNCNKNDLKYINGFYSYIDDILHISQNVSGFINNLIIN